MDDCQFCKILRKEIPCAKVYEDDSTFAFLNITPINPGHTLVISKRHHETIFDIPEDDLAQMVLTTKKVALAVRSVTKCDGLNVGMNNFRAAEQVVPHTHFHVIPRFENDGLRHWPGKRYKDGEMEKIANELAVKLI